MLETTCFFMGFPSAFQTCNKNNMDIIKGGKIYIDYGWIIKTPFVKAGMSRNGISCQTLHALIDTGCSMTAISRRAWDFMELQQEGVLNYNTPFGSDPSPVSSCNVILNDSIEIQDLQVALHPFIDTQDVDMLIGMDILSKGNLSIDNSSGSTILRFEIN